MDNRIKNFITDLETVSSQRVKLVNKLRKMFKSANSDLKERFIYGGIGVYLGDKLIGGVWVYTNHTSVIFSDGRKLKDPEKILEGGGKYRRHIKISSKEDIKTKKVENFIKEYIALEIKK